MSKLEATIQAHCRTVRAKLAMMDVKTLLFTEAFDSKLNTDQEKCIEAITENIDKLESLIGKQLDEERTIKKRVRRQPKNSQSKK